jgi:hypothetical protein
LITEGILFRFVPNWQTHWEYDLNRPSPRAFRRRPGEEYVSAYLDGKTSVAALADLYSDFAICALEVPKLLAHNSEIWVTPRPISDVPEGLALVGIYGINRNRAEWVARELSKTVKGPAAASPPKNPRDDDGPRDRWRS